MNYDLALKLKEAGFPQTVMGGWYPAEKQEDVVKKPTLSELIEAVGFCFDTLKQEHNDRTPEGYLKFSGWKALAVDADCSWGVFIYIILDV